MDRDIEFFIASDGKAFLLFSCITNHLHAKLADQPSFSSSASSLKSMDDAGKQKVTCFFRDFLAPDDKEGRMAVLKLQPVTEIRHRGISISHYCARALFSGLQRANLEERDALPCLTDILFSAAGPHRPAGKGKQSHAAHHKHAEGREPLGLATVTQAHHSLWPIKRRTPTFFARHRLVDQPQDCLPLAVR